MTDLKNTDIAGLMPHSGKMVLLDRLVDYDDISATAELVVRNDGLIGDGKTVPAWAGIEYMAQTIAVYAGIMAKIAGDPIKLGFLLGTRRYKSNVAEFKVGSTLSVRVEKIMQDERLGVFDCRIQGDGVEISANLNVYEPPITQ
ncbi:MAG: hotdog family protein [Methylobacter sp.]|jgi:predicted hotdog family 3-hydroxylacyl-ACP dehydratase